MKISFDFGTIPKNRFKLQSKKCNNSFKNSNVFFTKKYEINSEEHALLKNMKKEYINSRKQDYYNSNSSTWYFGPKWDKTHYFKSEEFFMEQLGKLVQNGKWHLVEPYYNSCLPEREEYIKNKLEGFCPIGEKLDYERLENQKITLPFKTGMEEFFNTENFVFGIVKNNNEPYLPANMHRYYNNGYNNTPEKYYENSIAIFKRKLSNELKTVSLGEIREKYPACEDFINLVLSEKGLDSNGYYIQNIPINYPEPIDKEAYKKKEDDINNSAETKRKEAIASAKKANNRKFGTGIKRVAIDAVTLGIHELFRLKHYHQRRDWYLKNANDDIALERENLAGEMVHNTREKRKQIEKIEGALSKIQLLEDKKEISKKVLTTGLIDKINNFYRGVPVRNMPNCVMFVGQNQYMAKDLAKWASETTQTDFVLIEGRLDNNKLQKDIYTELIASEENYQKTGRRTLMFVDGMDKLLIPGLNSDENIAGMKNIMQCASDDFHTTILFSGEDPKKYATGINTLGRIGLKVPIDITEEESNVKKIIEETKGEYNYEPKTRIKFEL